LVPNSDAGLVQTGVSRQILVSSKSANGRREVVASKLHNQRAISIVGNAAHNGIDVTVIKARTETGKETTRNGQRDPFNRDIRRILELFIRNDSNIDL
jgi:hypothetical protein